MKGNKIVIVEQDLRASIKVILKALCDRGNRRKSDQDNFVIIMRLNGENSFIQFVIDETTDGRLLMNVPLRSQFKEYEQALTLLLEPMVQSDLIQKYSVSDEDDFIEIDVIFDDDIDFVAGIAFRILKHVFKGGETCVVEVEFGRRDLFQIIENRLLERKENAAAYSKETLISIEDIVLGKAETKKEKMKMLIVSYGFTAQEAQRVLSHAAEEEVKVKLRSIKRLITNKVRDEYGEFDLINRRDPISDEVKMFVWQRDQGRCVTCGSNEKLEFDHIIPVSKGGSNTERNLQLLCEPCNREKSANI